MKPISQQRSWPSFRSTRLFAVCSSLYLGSALTACKGDAENGAPSGEVKVASFTQFVSVEQPQVDLLFVIDDSPGMAEKQALFAESIETLLSRLLTPRCLDGARQPVGVTDAFGSCAVGSPEFLPARDLHVAVVSSSLGGHGSTLCADADGDRHGLQQGFVSWDPLLRESPPGEHDRDAFLARARDMVSLGQHGCELESPLEAWYRFLVDPQPILSVNFDGTLNLPVYTSSPNDNPVLKQRAEFLRHDSTVGIVMLSDENDCSVIDSGQGWLVGTSTLNGAPLRLPRSNTACAAGPNERCCASCLSNSTPPGCPPLADDPSCADPFYSVAEDPPALRCFDQKRRFGIDLLYPLSRYVDGLTSDTVVDRDGNTVQNPLFAGGRAKSRVILGGITGVPWQDLAEDVEAPGLRIKAYDAIDWGVILGSPPMLPLDKLMFESNKDRTVLFGNPPHPILGSKAALASSLAIGLANDINGHELNTFDRELQPACIFPLRTPRECTSSAESCDCGESGQFRNSPACQGILQTHDKAYPGVRELSVLRDFGAKSGGHAAVGSICAKSVDASLGDGSYGYEAAMTAVADTITGALGDACLRQTLSPDPATGRVACVVAEALLEGPYPVCADCASLPGRRALSPTNAAKAQRALFDLGYCGDFLPCDFYCLCEIEQLGGDALGACQTETTPPAGFDGFCYVDPAAARDEALAQEEARLVAHCAESNRRMLRFAGQGAPIPGAITMVGCSE